MTAAVIEVRGARQNNLRAVDLDVPKGKLVVFTGVSGSGKSSLVFGTIAAESQRLINETYTAFLQSLMPALPRPDVDRLSNLSAAIVVDQERLGSNSRSTVGTATDAWTMLRVLYARAGEPRVPGPSALSFNDPTGMCPRCEGLGRVSDLDVDAAVDRSRSLNGGAITFPNFAVDSLFWRVYGESGFFDNDKPLARWTDTEIHQLLRGTGRKVKTGSYSLQYEGLLDKIERLYLSKDVDSLQPHVRRAVAALATVATCPECAGTRLGEAARGCTVAGQPLAGCGGMQVSDLADWARTIDEPPVAPVVAGLVSTLDNLVEIGLGYLSLDRQTGTLSGGESQRVKMVRHLDSALTDLTYVFDEPTSGLHAHDTARMIRLLERLRDKGNTVLVVEHDPDVISAADHVVDIGPGAGSAGGQVVFQGDVTGLRAADTPTGRHLHTRAPIRTTSRPATGQLVLHDITRHNLRNVSVSLPLGVLTAVTGVAGSGKSSLVIASVPRDEGVVVVDQSPIKGSRRSNPATWTGVLDGIRDSFAHANKVKPALFSANSEGACTNCNGLGVTYTDLAYMPGVSSPCETCDGRRFTDQVLAYRLRGRTIADVLALSISEAAAFFAGDARAKGVVPMLTSLDDVGLGYLTLGQPLTSLSGGERQRLRLAVELARNARILVLDEPTSGLHLADVDHLVALLDRIVDGGTTVIVIEHNLDVVARADWVVDVGPGAGHHGGRIIYEGPPATMPADGESVTGRYLHASRPSHKDEVSA